MYNYYCKNCNNIVGKWNNEYEWYKASEYCKFIESKNNDSIFFLDCKKCNKFVGIYCWNVCGICFGKNQIFGEKNLLNWFSKHKKIINKNCMFLDPCNICNKEKYFRHQFWFFEELTFHKK